ncbi:carbohydrate kinase family protein [Anaerolentibacter hominis]|uniref:carbohydrate kinase family protein n=1 Tax=Anaerolentibacter hominis TaxID=3079009 RepID=UPI0031B85029
MKKKTAVVAGQICLDLCPVFPPKENKRVEDVLLPGKLTSVDDFEMFLGGAVPNTGLAMQKQGADVRYMGKVGKDSFGDVIRNMLKAAGGSADYLITDEKVNTSCTVVLAPKGLDRMFVQYAGVNDTFCYDDIHFEDIKDAALFHFGYPGIMKQMYVDGGSEMIKIFKKVKEMGVATSLDMVMIDPASEAAKTDWRKLIKEIIPYVDFFVPSAAELAFMMDRPLFDEWLRRADGGDVTEHLSISKDIKPLADQLMEWGAKVVLIKCGLPGIYLRTADEETLAKAGSQVADYLKSWANEERFEESYVAEVVKSGVGAGDTTIAAFLNSMLMEYPLEKCLQYAVGTGASCVEEYDSLTGVMTFDQLEERIKKGWKKQGLYRE